MKAYIEKHVSNINRILDEELKKEKSKYVGISHTLEKLIDMFNIRNDGGKRIRAILVVLGYEINGGVVTEEIYKAAATYEIFQTAILIHDDYIDDSDLRRGKMTVQVELGRGHEANSNAICLGDYGIFLSQKILANINIKPEYLLNALRVFDQTLMNTIVGEIMDVNSVSSKYADEKRVYDISYYKTAWYTIIGPMMLGAALAGQDISEMEDIEEFGKQLGIAFQIKDDILGIFGDEDVVGKSVRSDIEEKKLTLLYFHVMNNCKDENKKIFENIYGKKNITEKELELVRNIMEETGALECADNELEDRAKKSEKVITKLTSDEYYRNILRGLVEYICIRKR